jgi:hypothetical protein
MPGEDEQAAEHRLQEDRELGGAQQVPEADRGTIAIPGDAPEGEGGGVEQDQSAANYEMDLGHAISS